MKAFLHSDNGETREISFIAAREGNKTSFRVPRYTLLHEVRRFARPDFVEFTSELWEAAAGDEGYMLASGGIANNTTLLYFRDRADFTYREPACVMPMMGIRHSGRAYFVIATGMYMDFAARYTVKDSHYALSACFLLHGDDPYEEISFDLYDLGDADYNGMAHVYREYQIKKWGLRPLRERTAAEPWLKYAAESIELRIRMGWKPSPSDVPHQTPETEPPMHVAMTFDRVCEIIDKLKAAGVEKCEICLVGWNRGGHDGRFPQLFPPEPALGGAEGMAKAIAKAKAAGYAVVCHDNYTGAYEVAECWDEEFVAKTQEGKPWLASARSLSGGNVFIMCPQRAYERFAVNRIPKLAECGYEGLHFVDVFSAVPPRKCYDYRHPVNAADCRDYYLRIMNLSRKYIGGFQSEGPFDFVAPELDYCLYTTMRYHTANDPKFPACDETVPFWELVYHGYILSNPCSTTANYPLKEKAQEVHLMERGGRPLMYYYSKFGEKKNWMGDIDLRCETEQEEKDGIAAVRKAYDNVTAYGYLLYETMERHEKLAENVFRTTYSDGTVVVADYNNDTFEVRKG